MVVVVEVGVVGNSFGTARAGSPERCRARFGNFPRSSHQLEEAGEVETNRCYYCCYYSR